MRKLVRIAESDESPVFIVAHSHGGNIAAQAADQVGWSWVRGVACLGTPFLEAERLDRHRATWGYVLRAVAGPLLLLATLAIPVAIQGLLLAALEALDASPLFTILVWCPLIIPTVQEWFVHFLFKPIELLLAWIDDKVIPGVDSWLAQREGDLDDLSLAGPENARSLRVARVEGDEASIYLRSLLWLSNLPNVLVSWAGLAIISAFSLLICIGVGVGFMQAWHAPKPLLYILPVVFSVSLGFSGGCILAVAGTAGLILSGHAGGVGYMGPLAHLRWRIRVNSVPGCVHVARSYRYDGKGLRHSSLYSMAQVHQDLGQWVNESLRDDATRAACPLPMESPDAQRSG